jgi:hypothetical protein
MLGVTATLTAAMYQEVVSSAGFRDSATLVRHPINRPKTLYHFEATADSIGVQKRVVYLIASATKKVANGDASQLTKSIFFVNQIRDTVYLRRSIIQWLVEFGFQEAEVAPRIEIYHGRLTDATRSSKQARFHTGDIRIIVCTVSFATGVNPPGVQLVCQIGRCSPSDAVQKGGRGGRQGGGKPEEESMFIWIVPIRIIGPQAHSIGQQLAPFLLGTDGLRPTHSNPIPNPNPNLNFSNSHKHNHNHKQSLLVHGYKAQRGQTSGVMNPILQWTPWQRTRRSRIPACLPPVLRRGRRSRSS